MYYRVFAKNQTPIELDDLVAHIPEVVNIRGDDQGWFHADLHFPDEEMRLELEQFLATEEGIRAELNTWAAWLEAQDHEHSRSLMEHMIQTTRVITLTAPVNEPVDTAALAIPVCQLLAQRTDGVYQVDGKGFFAADGALLIGEEVD